MLWKLVIINYLYWVSMQNTLKDSYVPLYKVDGLTLSVLSSEEVDRMAVQTIDEYDVYKTNGDPITHGINDDLMGTMDKDRLCKTCRGSQVDCPGHFGQIKLVKPVFHGNLIDYVRKVLRCVCCKCSHLLADQLISEQMNEGDGTLKSQQKLPKIDELKILQQIRNNKSRFNALFKLSQNLKQCKSCGTINHKYRRMPLAIEYEIQDPSLPRPGNDPKQTLWPEEAQRILNNITEEHLEIMGLNKKTANPANMIIENLAVAPPPVRPSVAQSGASRSEDDLTIAYKAIIQHNRYIRQSIANGANESQIKEFRKNLQFHVATVMDNEISGTGTQKHKTGKSIKAIRARLKGKEGRLRGNLMGKRVDFSARTVITPDPNLRLDQLGVPKEIAMNLTIPEVVTEHNQAYLRQLVNNGANNWPGAKYIKNTVGRYIDLSVLQNRTDQHLEIGYTVERHLNHDDYVMFNRQPSLHKMSLMGHRVRVLPFQTFRLNLSATTPYNADFDGDEMNMHVPQSLETKAEVKEIMSVPRQIVAPQGNKPCMGIVQDALLGISRLTNRDTFIDKPFVMNILMWVNYNFDLGLPHPAIIKPKPLWTGKQILSLIIPKSINLENGDKWMSPKDETIVIQQGELLAGVVAKKIVGNTPGGLIHIIWKDLGPQACCDILSNIQLVVNNWLVNTGYTVGVSDIVAKSEIIDQVQAKIREYKKEVKKVISTTQMGKLVRQPGRSTMESFENNVNSILNNARNDAGNIALDALDSSNRLKGMVFAGSKGSNMNISQIMACVGQQNVEGKRIPFGFGDRSLPHFTKGDYGPESKGFVENSYLTGLTPSEFYFHAMGGREGLIDTAVKTATTGYISRRLIKALEDVMVKYDGTVRTSKELIIQFLYGEDGMAGEMFESINLDLTKLDNKKLESNCNFLQNIQNEDKFKADLEKKIKKEYVTEIVEDRLLQAMFRREYEQLKADRDNLRYNILTIENESSIPMPVNLPRLITNVKAVNGIRPNSVCDIDPLHYFAQMKKLQESLVVIPQARLPITSKLIEEAHYNSMMFFKIFLRRYLCSKKIMTEDRLDTRSFDQLVKSISEVFRSAVVHPGEMVGGLCAHSMGEPATQMTLNTFHNAGISSKNVTLGVPRLNEVINVARTIKTPSLKIFVDPSISKDEKEVYKLGAQIEYTNLSHLISDWGIYYDPDPTTTIIQEDKKLIDLYQETKEMQSDRVLSRWLIRFKIDSEKTKGIFNEYFEFKRDVVNKIDAHLNNPVTFEIVSSEDTHDSQVIRIRLYDTEEMDDQDLVIGCRNLAESVLQEITLRGFEAISKVSFTKSSNESKAFHYDKDTGAFCEDKDNWLIETDGIDLANVMALEGIDYKRTTSNNVTEILQVLGIEATRNSLIRELRIILRSYDIYVNYRHLGTLVDMMTNRGILTSITRHGINRVNSGPLRKCTFEETCEILFEAAFFGEHDPISGISENIIFGQLAQFGTGYCDLIVDGEALANCVENRAGGSYIDYPQSSEHTPMIGDDAMTPKVFQTPAHGLGTSVTGQTSYYQQNMDNAFTPKHHAGVMSPSPSYAMGMGGDSVRYSPGYSIPGNFPTGKSPGYAVRSPHMGYTGTGYYSSGSPQIGQHSSYSPTNLMAAFQSPSYSPTTPNYNQGINPIIPHTPSYQYGAPNSSGVPVYSMPNVSSPRHQQKQASPIVGGMQGNSGAHSSSAYGASPSNPYSTSNAAYNPIMSPSYSSTLAPNRNYGLAMSSNQSHSGSSIGPGPAYEAKKSGNNSESSDSEEK